MVVTLVLILLTSIGNKYFMHFQVSHLALPPGRVKGLTPRVNKLEKVSENMLRGIPDSPLKTGTREAHNARSIPDYRTIGITGTSPCSVERASGVRIPKFGLPAGPPEQFVRGSENDANRD